MPATAYLCETDSHVQFAQLDSDALIVPLTPEAWWRLTLDGASHVIPEEFYDERALMDLREPVLRMELDWLNWLDQELQSEFPSLAEQRLPVAGLWTYCLKRLIDQLVINGFILDRILGGLKTTQVVHAGREDSQPNWGRFFRKGPYGRIKVPEFSPAALLPLFAGSRDIRVSQFPAENAAAPTAPSNRSSVKRAGEEVRRMLRPDGLALYVANSLRMRPWSSRLVDEMSLLRSLGFRRGLGMFAARLTGKGPRVLVLRSGYDLTPLLRESVRHGVSVEFLGQAVRSVHLLNKEAALCADISLRTPHLWTRLETNDRFRGPFTVQGVDVFPLVKEGLRYFITRVVGESVRQFCLARQAMSGGRYRALLAPGGSRATMALHAARLCRVPVVMFQHGGFVGTCEQLFWDLTDLRHGDHFFVYGDGMREYFEDRVARTPEARARVLVTGSPRLEHLGSQLGKIETRSSRRRALGGQGRITALYVTTKTSGYARALVAASYPEVAYWRLQGDVVDLMRRFPDVAFVYKPFVDYDDRLIRQMLDQKGVANCRVVRKFPLPTLMHTADVILLDFPSTGLLEAVLTDKPIVVLADRRSLRLNPRAAALLRRRAVVAETPDAFLEAIAVALGPEGPTRLSDNGYARAFAWDPRHGSATRRAWEYLDAIMRDGNPDVVGRAARERGVDGGT